MDTNTRDTRRRNLVHSAKAAWTAILGFLVWSEVVLSGRLHRSDHFAAVVAGVVVCALVIGIWLLTTGAALRRQRTAPTDPSDVPALESADTIVSTSATRDDLVDGAGHLQWVDAANRLLRMELENMGPSELPHVGLVRAGMAGVELLLGSECLAAPPSFQVLENGRVWRLNPEIELQDILTSIGPSSAPFLPVLIEVGEDRNATFFVAAEPGESVGIAGSDVTDTLNHLITNLLTAPWTAVSLFRLDDAKFEGAEEVPSLSVQEVRELDKTQFANDRRLDTSKVPVIVADDRGLTELLRGQLKHAVLIGAAVSADHLLYRDNDTFTIEPVGLTVRLTSGHSLPVDEEPVDDDVSPEVSAWIGEDGMPPRGAVEVRILREHPDLVGDLEASPTGVAVQFVAYLALHGGRVTTSRLRDALGSYRRDASKANKTVWSAAGAARQVLGATRVPNATGNQQYELSAEVTCDWSRFAESFQRARSAHAARDTSRAVSLLAGALELFEGLPSADERRFDWIETEGIIHEIQRVVEEAAHLLASIAIGTGSAPLAKWAVERGRLAAPISELLEQDEIAIEGSTELQSLHGPSEAR
jgi:hypothetical protein